MVHATIKMSDNPMSELHELVHTERERHDAIRRTEVAMSAIDTVTSEGLGKDQLIQGLDKVESVLDENLAKPTLRGDGRKVVADTHDLVETTKSLIQKHEGIGDVFQELMRESMLALKEVNENFDVDDVKSVVPSDKGLRRRAKSASERTLSLLRTLAFSAEGRQVAREFALLMRQLFYRLGDQIENAIMYKAHEQVIEEKQKEVVSKPISAKKRHSRKMRKALKEKEEAEKALGTPEQGKENAEVVLQNNPDILKAEAEARLKSITNLSTSILRRLLAHPELKSVIADFREISMDYKRRADVLLDASVDQASQVIDAPTSHASKAAAAAQRLVEMLAPTDTLPDIKAKLEQLARAVIQDAELNAWLQRVNNWLTDALDHPEIIQEQSFQDNAEKLWHDGQEVFSHLSDEVSDLGHDLFNQAEDLLDEIQNDETLMSMNESLQNLAQDLLKKDRYTGNVQLNTRALEQIRQVIAPEISSSLKFVALPPMDFSSESYDLQVKDMVVSLADLPPSAITAHFEHLFSFDTVQMAANQNCGRLNITFRDIHFIANNFEFHLLKKSWPKIHDGGHASLKTAGNGVKIDLSFTFKMGAYESTVIEADCVTNIEDLHLDFGNDVDNQVLFNLVAAFYKDDMAKQISSSISNQLKDLGNKFASKLGEHVDFISQWLPGPLKSLVGSSSSEDDVPEIGKLSL